MTDDTPTPSPPVAPQPWEATQATIPLQPLPRRTHYLPWMVAGCGAGLLIVALLFGGLLLALPQLREEVVLLTIPSQASAPPPPESPRPPQPLVPGPVRIKADFNGPSTAWEQAGARIVDGTYELRVDTPNFDSYGLYLGASGAAIDTLDLAVDVTLVEGPTEAEYGIRFRQPGPENYLMLSISGSGYYRLARVEGNQHRSLVPWTFSPRIKTGAGAVNRLRVVAEGSQIRGYINDSQFVDAEDTAGLSGQLALGATTFNSGGLVVRFDNLVGQAEGADLEQDFSNAEGAGWSAGGSRFIGGEYEMFAGAGIQLLQQPQPPGSSKVSDFTLDVDARLTDGAGSGVGYGILFGYSENFSYYGLLLLPEGGMQLYRSGPEGNSELLPATAIPAVKQGLNQVNQIRLEVQAGRLSVAINGEQVIDDVQIGEIEGEVGMLVNSGQGRVVARFDNFNLQPIGKRA